MAGSHLTLVDLENYSAGMLEDTSRLDLAEHLAICSECRIRASRSEKFESSLRGLPRHAAPRQLADRIIAAVDWRVTQDEDRLRRLPYIAFATAAAVVISLWFAFQTIADLYDTDTIDLLYLFSSRPDLLLTYYSDGLSALWESLPLPVIAMTLFAIAVAIVLAQQLMANFHPAFSNKLRRV